MKFKSYTFLICSTVLFFFIFMFLPNYLYQKYDDYQLQKCLGSKEAFEKLKKQKETNQLISPNYVKCIGGVYCLAVDWGCLPEKNNFLFYFKLFLLSFYL